MDQKDKSSDGTLYKVFGVAKKLSARGLQMLDQKNADEKTVAKTSLQSIAFSANKAPHFEKAQKPNSYHDPREMLRDHLPQVSRQVLGRHFQTVNRVTHFISPELNDKVSDYFFDHLNQFSNDTSSVDAILDESGISNLEELTQDVDRSKRISTALAEQNKWLASLQGALSGATGVLGSAIDIPVSLTIALRVIYQVGRSYGFDLEKEQDQEVVQYIFKQINLGLIAEKQTLLMALKALMTTVQQHDVSQLQHLLGSDNDLQLLKRFLSGQDGQVKWSWVNQLGSSGFLRQLTRLHPIAGAGIGAVYSWRLVDDVQHKAQEVFSLAREYLIEHKEQIDQLTPFAAYEKAIALLTEIAENSKKIDTSKIMASLMAQNDVVQLVQDGDVIIPVIGEAEQVANPISSERSEVSGLVSSSEAELIKSQSEKIVPSKLGQAKNIESIKKTKTKPSSSALVGEVRKGEDSDSARDTQHATLPLPVENSLDSAATQPQPDEETDTNK